MHVDIPYTSIMTSFIFFEKLESAFGPAVPNTPSVKMELLLEQRNVFLYVVRL